MKETRLPTISLNGAPPRKQSSMNLDALYSSLLLILNNHPCPGSVDLIPYLTQYHNSIVARLGINPTLLIANMKRDQIWFTSYLRGIRLPQGEYKLSSWNSVLSCPINLEGFVRWHMSFCNKITPSDVKNGLHQYDYDRMIQVIYAILSGHRVIVVPTKPNYSTITDLPPLWIQDLDSSVPGTPDSGLETTESESTDTPTLSSDPISSPIPEGVSLPIGSSRPESTTDRARRVSKITEATAP